MKYQADEAPSAVLALADRLLPLLIQGDDPALAALREQLPRARMRDVEMTGVGFYIHFEVSPEAPLTEPANFAGGCAEIRLAGVEYPAGCVLFVRGGRLAMLEGYTTTGDQWPEDAVVISVENVVPVCPG